MVTNVEQQGCRLLIDKSGDGCVAVSRLPSPIELARQGVESPQLGVVALRGDDRLRTEIMCQVTCQLVGSSDMAGEYGDHEAAGAVDADHSRVGMFVGGKRGDRAHTNA